MNGQLTKMGTGWQLRFIRKFPHKPEDVWRALTEPEQLAGWFPAAIEGKREEGATLRFVFPTGESETLEGTMRTYEPPSELEYTWGDDELRFELGPEGEDTVLVFETKFDELGKAARDAAGWDVRLDMLGYRLAGQEPPWDHMERWEQVHPGYVEEFGPEASTIGPPESVKKADRRAA
jgi:uncharacterized protein YndB with AHSA1/START domain